MSKQSDDILSYGSKYVFNLLQYNLYDNIVVHCTQAQLKNTFMSVL